jgi:hypothetical protein
MHKMKGENTMKTSDFEALYPILDWTNPSWGEIDISATITYTTPGQYGHIQHTYGSVTYRTRADLLRAICNAADVLATPGTSHIVVDAETRLAYQIAGYSPRHGAFSTVVPREKLLPYLNT